MRPRPRKWAFTTLSSASGGISFLRGSGVVVVEGREEIGPAEDWGFSASGWDRQAEAARSPIAVIAATARRRQVRGGIVTLLRMMDRSRMKTRGSTEASDK
jgi:hypothetical protein